MNKTEIIDKLRLEYGSFAELLGGLSEADFSFSLNSEKWAAGQQIDHLCRSVAPLNKGLRAPEFALKAMFGKADRPSASYEELVSRYRSELAAGGTAPEPFRPDPIPFDQLEELAARLSDLVETLCQRIAGMEEEKLDVIMLPHPLLGKLTLREMFYFTIYHAEHHRLHTEQNLASRAQQQA